MQGLMVFLSWFHQALSQNFQVRSNIIFGCPSVPYFGGLRFAFYAAVFRRAQMASRRRTKKRIQSICSECGRLEKPLTSPESHPTYHPKRPLRASLARLRPM
jgi:hypothetical protein